jgi:hypothetical protein
MYSNDPWVCERPVASRDLKTCQKFQCVYSTLHYSVEHVIFTAEFVRYDTCTHPELLAPLYFATKG